jgi:hypothetical protein
LEGPIIRIVSHCRQVRAEEREPAQLRFLNRRR